MKAGEPARDVLAEVVVVGAEHFLESGLLVEQDEEVNAENDGNGGEYEDGVGAAKNDPEADPADEETHIHGIADIAVKPDDN
jgi:hypothetical protein